MKKLLKFIVGAIVVVVLLFLFLGAEKEVVEDTSPATVEASIDGEVSALGVTIRVLEVVEDSRCPANAKCIWAGTVKVRAKLTSGLGTAEQLFELNVPITTEAETITLTSVEPAPYAGVSIKPEDYVFIFSIAKRSFDTIE